MNLLKRFLIILAFLWGVILYGVGIIGVACWVKATLPPVAGFLLIMVLISVPLSFVLAYGVEE